MTSDENDRRDRSVPETLRLRMISPSLTVKDVQTSLAFYRDVVGFTVSELWEREGKVLGADLVAGSSHLLIGQDDGAKGWDRTKGVGMRLYFSTSQSLDDLASAIKSRGGTLASEPEEMPWGGRAFSIVDPDGFNITISSVE